MGDRPRDEQDPFEDLDQFFAPIEDDDWPEGREAEAGAGQAPPEYAATEGGAGADALAGLDELELDLPDEGELLAERAPEPASAKAPDDADADGPPASRGDDAAAEPPAAPESPAAAEPVPGSEAPPGQEWDLERAETQGEEWDRLRAEALAATAAEPEAEDPAGEQPLSVDDLSTSPPQYDDLPRPAETADEPSGPVLEDPLSGAGIEDEGVFGPEDSGVDLVGGGPPTPESPDATAVGADDRGGVEAAAERFAAGMHPDEVERELLSDLDEPGDPETVRIEPTAPAATEASVWEEEAAAEAEEPRAPSPTVAGRNVTAAMISGILLAAAVLALLAIGKGAFAVLVVAVVLLGQAELYAVMRTRGFQPATLLGLVSGGVMLGGAYLQGEGALLLGPALAVGLTVPWYMAVAQPARRHVAANAATTVFGLMYVPFFASFAMLILRAGDAVGRDMFLVVLAMTVLYDVSAYAVGTIWGNRPLAPTISPHKSWEGAVGASLVTILIGLTIVPNIDPFTAGMGTGLALLIAVAAPLGDLVESALKRDFEVKDMGSLLPGHGGVLDRIDAVLFVMPVAYFFLRIVLGG